MVMIRSNVYRLSLVVLAAMILGACQPATDQAGIANEKIPITTSSDEALAAFLEARELQENLHGAEAREFFLKAVESDDEFASAYLGLAFTATNATEFFEALARATELADSVSEGERLAIRAFEAGVNGEPDRQLRLLEALVAAYPNDERARNQMGQFHFGRQEWDRAVESLRHVNQINPEFAQSYNQLGYALRFMGDFAGAEEAFQKYVELIPGEPNPYDSYAELLMKTGRFDESIVQYKKALEVDPNFIASYIGIGNNLMFKGDFDGAREAFGELYEVARNDGQRRLALTWTAFSYLHQRRHEQAIAKMEEAYRIAETRGDLGNMAGDLNTMGDILLNIGQTEAALAKYQEQIAMSDRSNATEEVKETVRRNHIADLARVALREGDLEAAAREAQRYREQVDFHGIPGELRQSHELFGLIAMANGEFQRALDEFSRANQQDARVMLYKAQAMKGLGDEAGARGMVKQAAHYNSVGIGPVVAQNYALIRPQALDMIQG
jgi:tetratricopeptide (TPR) repeat protein